MTDAKHRDAADGFEPHRAHLTGLAYRMLGSLVEAQDVVQEAYLRWHRSGDGEAVDNPRAFLSKTVARLCLDQLKSARTRRELYVGPWLPEPILDENENALTSETAGEYAHDLSVALMLTLERLSPPERAAFLLHDVFDMEFEEVASVLGRTSASCRQLAARARTHVRAARPRFRTSPEECERLAAAFGAAVRSGDATALANILAEDAVFLSDGGGKLPAALRPIYGRERIVRLFTGLIRKAPIRERGLGPSRINGYPGFVIEAQDGRVMTVTLDFREGRVSTIYVVSNPEKLQHVTGEH